MMNRKETKKNIVLINKMMQIGDAEGAFNMLVKLLDSEGEHDVYANWYIELAAWVYYRSDRPEWFRRFYEILKNSSAYLEPLECACGRLLEVPEYHNTHNVIVREMADFVVDTIKTRAMAIK